MTEEQKAVNDEMSPIKHGVPPGLDYKVHPTDEYKVGHHKPPLVLVVLYVLVIVWAGISWIPFYGY